MSRYDDMSQRAQYYVQNWDEIDLAEMAARSEAHAKQLEDAIDRVRALHPEGTDDLCESCHVPWPCPDICCLNGPPGCRNCGEHHIPVTDRTEPQEPRT